MAPYHPASNGLAERAVQIFKRGMKSQTDGNIETKLSRFLLSYRRLPQSTTGLSPAELLMGRKLRTRLDRVFPNKSVEMFNKQQKMKQYHDQHAKPRVFNPDDKVYIKDLRSSHSHSWIPGVVVSRTGPVSYIIEIRDGQQVRRHVDHLRIRHNECKDPITLNPEPCPVITTNDTSDVPNVKLDIQSTPPMESVDTPEPISVHKPSVPEHSTVTETVPSPSKSVVLRRSNRTIKPPDRLTYS